jgi:hypothetical protein
VENPWNNKSEAVINPGLRFVSTDSSDGAKCPR